MAKSKSKTKRKPAAEVGPLGERTARDGTAYCTWCHNNDANCTRHAGTVRTAEEKAAHAKRVAEGR